MTISEIGEVRESRINIAKGQLHLLWTEMSIFRAGKMMALFILKFQ